MVSVDCKKKELINGTKANAGREWQPKGAPERVDVHDFPDPEVPKAPKATPYGVFDTGANEGWMSVGSDHDTTAFAVNAIRRWWLTMGAERYPQATQQMADGHRRCRRVEQLPQPALKGRAREPRGRDRPRYHRVPLPARHLEVEQGRTPHVQLHHAQLAGRPLTSYRVIVELAAATTTEAGLRVQAEWDQGYYPTGVKITDAQLAALPLTRHELHGDWNYDLVPGTETTNK